MPKTRKDDTPRITIYVLDRDPKDLLPKDVTCFYCGMPYKDDSKVGCPTCGGTVTSNNQSPIGKAYDMYMNPNFKPEKIPNGEQYFVPPEMHIQAFLKNVKKPI